jgi:hypothetical protein
VRSRLLKAKEGELKPLMSVINLGEVWYSIARATNPETADQYVNEIRGMSIDILDADWPLTRQAAAFKAGGQDCLWGLFCGCAGKKPQN